MSGVLLEADTKRRWRYWGWLTSVGIIAVPAVGVGSFVFDERSSLADSARLAMLIFGLISGYGLCYSAFVIFRISENAYVIDNCELRVVRRNIVKERIDLRRIERAVVVGGTPERFHLFAIALSYDWPRLVLEVRGERRPRELATVMVWGTASLDDAERRLGAILRRI